jgi:hypothetical protein
MFTTRTLLSMFAVTALSTTVAAIDATGASVSPGFISGNVIQIPVDIPVNVCGNTVNVIGILNPAFGNNCENNTVDVRQLRTPVTITASIDHTHNVYKFKVRPGVKLNLCGVKLEVTGEDEFEFSCNAGESVTIG